MGGGFGHHGPGLELDAAASFLGLTEAELRTRLQSGKTLAQVAKDKGKTVDGLEQALLDAASKRLDQAVADGRITAAQKATMLAQLKSRIADMVDGTLPAGPKGMHGPPGSGQGAAGTQQRRGGWFG